MKFFAIDRHISVIADIKHIFNELGHEVHDLTLSGHSWVMGRRQDKLKFNIDDKQIFNKSLWRKFHHEYRKELEQYDGFICCYPPAFSALYKEFNKPIIVQTPIRYEHPYSNDKRSWEQLNEFLRQDNVHLCANNLADKYWIQTVVKKPCKHIPSLCEYTGIDYTLHDGVHGDWVTDCKYGKLLDMPDYREVLGSGYSWTDLLQFQGIFCIPYQFSWMSLFEYYSANIPLAFPSKELMMKLYQSGRVLQEYSWNKYFNLPPKSIISCEPDLNAYNDLDLVSQWLGFSDYYNSEWMPFITYIDDFVEFEEQLGAIRTDFIANEMRDFNKYRKGLVYERWESVLERI